MKFRDRRMTWHGTDLRKDDIAFDLTPGHAAALQELLDKVPSGRGSGLGRSSHGIVATQRSIPISRAFSLKSNEGVASS